MIPFGNDVLTGRIVYNGVGPGADKVYEVAVHGFDPESRVLDIEIGGIKKRVGVADGRFDLETLSFGMNFAAIHPVLH